MTDVNRWLVVDISEEFGHHSLTYNHGSQMRALLHEARW